MPLSLSPFDLCVGLLTRCLSTSVSVHLSPLVPLYVLSVFLSACLFASICPSLYLQPWCKIIPSGWLGPKHQLTFLSHPASVPLSRWQLFFLCLYPSKAFMFSVTVSVQSNWNKSPHTHKHAGSRHYCSAETAETWIRPWVTPMLTNLADNIHVACSTNTQPSHCQTRWR